MISRTSLYLYIADNNDTWATDAWAGFNMSTNTLANTGNDDTASTVVAAGILPFRHGWYRIWLAAQTPATTASVWLGSPQFLGDTSKGFYVWGAQFEKRSSPSPYASAQEVAFR